MIHNGKATIHKIGSTHYRRWIGKQQTYEVDVQQVDGTVAAHFASSMQIDADGAPKGYHESDESEWDNHQVCFDWLKNLKPSDRHGRQGIDGAIGPAYGFTISGTSLKDLNVASDRNTSRYVDASVIPYIVLPEGFPLAQGNKHAATIKDCLGSLAYVIDLVSGHSTGAVFADVGPRSGEASLATALRLGRQPFYPNCYPKVSGMDAKRFFTIVFPNSRLMMPLNVMDVQDRAQKLFHSWGDWTGLATALKHVGKERPPGAPDDAIATLTLPPPKGPVDHNPPSRPHRGYVVARTETTMLDAPLGRDVIARLPAGTQLELIETLPKGSWLRVIATAAGQIREGYLSAGSVRPRH